MGRIDDSLRLLGNQQWFSTMDLASGYWQVAMSAHDKWKDASVTHERLYQFQVMPFGLKQVRQFIDFIGYYRRFVQNFARLSEPLLALTWKGVTFMWTTEKQVAFDTLKACLLLF